MTRAVAALEGEQMQAGARLAGGPRGRGRRFSLSAALSPSLCSSHSLSLFLSPFLSLSISLSLSLCLSLSPRGQQRPEEPRYKALQTVGRTGAGQLARRPAGLRCGPDGPAHTGSGAGPGSQDPQRMPPLQGSAGPVGGPARRCRAARPVARIPRSSGRARGRVTAVTYGRDSEWSG